MQLSNIKADTIDFSLVSPTLEELDISYNVLTDVTFVNTIFRVVPGLQIINMTQQALTDSLFE